VKKSEIDRQIAKSLGKKRTEVRKITAAFLEQATQALVDEGQVNLRGFGRLKVVETPAWMPMETPGGQRLLPLGVQKVRVHFSKAESLTKALRSQPRKAGDHGEVRSRRTGTGQPEGRIEGMPEVRREGSTGR
jgi:nucleoid DNA-binding protein